MSHIEHKGLRMRILDQIKAERIRQISKEGWLPQHDAQRHADGSLALAAACYAAPCPIQIRGLDAWPLAKAWDKRGQHDRKRQLVIAAALIVAELERLEVTA